MKKLHKEVHSQAWARLLEPWRQDNFLAGWWVLWSIGLLDPSVAQGMRIHRVACHSCGAGLWLRMENGPEIFHPAVDSLWRHDGSPMPMVRHQNDGQSLLNGGFLQVGHAHVGQPLGKHLEPVLQCLELAQLGPISLAEIWRQCLHMLACIRKLHVAPSCTLQGLDGFHQLLVHGLRQLYVGSLAQQCHNGLTGPALFGLHSGEESGKHGSHDWRIWHNLCKVFQVGELLLEPIVFHGLCHGRQLYNVGRLEA